MKRLTFFIKNLTFTYLLMPSAYAIEKQALEPHIFFDVGHVLLKPSIPHLLWQIGPSKLLRYMFEHQSIPTKSHIQKKLFEYIKHCTDQSVHESIHSYGQPIPKLVYKWISGTVSTKDFLSEIHENPAKDHFFNSKFERDLILSSANLFYPETFVSWQRTVTPMVKLLKKCAKKFPGRVHILSNWDESCILLKESFSEVFTAIPERDIIFSYEVGCCKPDVEIFDLIAKRFEIQPAQCILIDDLAENITGIEKWGGRGILHVNPTKTRHELEKMLKNDFLMSLALSL